MQQIGYGHHGPGVVNSITAPQSLVDQTLAATPFSCLPQSLRPQGADEVKNIRTVAQLRAALDLWIREQPWDDQELMAAAFRYAQQTVEFAHQVPIERVKEYHRAAIAAALRQPKPQYDMLVDGERYNQGWVEFIQPHLKPDRVTRSWSRKSGTQSQQQQQPEAGSRKRSRSTAAGDECHIAGHVGHTNAECNTQKKAKAKSASQAAAQSSASVPAAATTAGT